MYSPISWMGSKRRLAKVILPHFPVHQCYVEPFAGSGALLFQRAEPAPAEVLNDINGDIVNFFRVAKHHLNEFCNQFRWAISSRQIFDWLKSTPPETLTDIQRAARFFYLQKLTFGGNLTGRSFGTSTSSKPHLNLVRLEECMSEVHTRLSYVNIEQLDWQKCVERYDRPHTLFFLDPPYFQVAGYGKKFNLADYKALVTAMSTIKGKALLTINDHKEMRKVFGKFKQTPMKIIYRNGSKPKPATELLISNF